MNQAQATIALRDAAEAGGDYIIDTDKARLVGIVTGTVRLDQRERISFVLLPYTVSGRRYPRQIVSARVLTLRPVRPGDKLA